MYKFSYNSIKYFSILLGFLFSCKKDEKGNSMQLNTASGTETIKQLWDYKYKNSLYSENTIEISFSNLKTRAIGSYIPAAGQQPEIFSSGKENLNTRITNNQLIEFSPVINDPGDYAYALSNNSDNVSKIYLNNRVIPATNNNLLYNHLAITDYHLAFSCFRLSDRTKFIKIYTIKTGELKEIVTPFYTQKLRYLNDSLLLIQGYNLINLSNDIYTYNLKSGILSDKFTSEEDELLFDVDYNKTYKVIIPKTNKPLFNATYALFETSKNQIFSLTGNDFGRASWYNSYSIESYIKLYEATGDELWKKTIIQNIDNLLKTQNEDMNTTNSFNPSFLWSAKKYSIDQLTPISLMVDNAKILYPMLVAYNKGIYTNPEILNISQQAYTYFDQFYNPSDSLYRFQKGIKFWADGLWVPFNQQNAWGLCLIELYKATSKPEYKTRMNEIAAKFKSEFTISGDYVTWNYWPNVFYNGWQANKNISTNTPNRAAGIDAIKADDVSHAGISVKFIQEYRRQFSQVFTQDHSNKIAKTGTRLQNGNKFARHIIGLTAKEVPLFRNLPLYGWCDVLTNDLQPFYKNIIPKIYPYFDAANAFVYDVKKDHSHVSYISRIVDAEGKIIKEE